MSIFAIGVANGSVAPRPRCWFLFRCCARLCAV